VFLECSVDVEVAGVAGGGATLAPVGVIGGKLLLRNVIPCAGIPSVGVSFVAEAPASCVTVLVDDIISLCCCTYLYHCVLCTYL